MTDNDKSMLGDGGANFGEVAQSGAQAVKEISKAAAQKAAATGAQAAGNAATAAVKAGMQTGGAVSGTAAGAAAGPWGAIIAAAWALRKPLFKVLICACLMLIILVVIIVTLPSIILNVSADMPTDIHEISDHMSDLIALCIQGGYDHALVEVERIIEANGYDYNLSMDALINNGSVSPEYDSCYVLAAYSASMGQRGTSASDLKQKLDAQASNMFKVTCVEKTAEKSVPAIYIKYKAEQVTVVTGKTFVGVVNGVSKYNYSTAKRTYYVLDGEETSAVEIAVEAYKPVSVEIPVYAYGAVTGSKSTTYYSPDGTATLTPSTETVKYGEFTIHPFDSGIFLVAFGIDPDASYDQFAGVTYAQAISTMADALKQTLYGTLDSNTISPLLDSELSQYVGSVQASAIRKEIVKTGLSLVGKVKYFWGGKSKAGWNDEWGKPKVVTSSGSVTTGTIRPFGLDCSGFTDWVYKTAGLGSIGTGSSSQWSKSTPISEAELLPGDLGFRGAPNSPGINHVGIFVGRDSSGKKQWVHCSSSKNGVVLNSPLYFVHYRRPNGKNLEGPSGANPIGTVRNKQRMFITHYCACAKCNGSNGSVSASGKSLAPGMVAMSGKYLFGTRIAIDGILYTCEDRGGIRFTNDDLRVDIFVSDHQEALRLGRYWAEVEFY